ncbi:hypothetical protein [Streptosporangium sp. CA-115845]|uniref:hypothetical protein n=1 Tax=Streptosporangium sp. CA-115845 TaxID=3240071 RepID=UPI003D8BF8E2
MASKRNERLVVLLEEAAWSRAQAASAFNRVAQEGGLLDYTSIGRSHISMWVAGTKPSGAAPIILCQALSRRLKRVVTPDELGFTVPDALAQEALEWHIDPLIALTELGRADLDTGRRNFLTGAVYSVAALALPDEIWWKTMAEEHPAPTKHQRIGRGDVDAVQQLTYAFSRIDQQRGGGHGRKALVQYLQSDVAVFLHGTFPDGQVRSDMFSAAAELAYLSGWMAFDNNEQAAAQNYFALAVKLAAHAGNPPLSGHVLRAMAHQALDLGFHRKGLELSTASMQGQSYASATPREKSLLGVVHARALAASDQRQAAAKALLKAEDDLASASEGIKEPHRTFFFAEASLAHETACTLRIGGDRQGALRQFRRSARTRGDAFRRTHVVTLGHLGAMQIATGGVEEACATWNTALDTMEEGIYSGRARRVVVDMRKLLSPYRRRKVSAVAELDARAAAYLTNVD